MQRTEIRAAGRLAGDALGGTGAIVRDVHRAVAGRTFGMLGVVGLPVRVVHDGISSAVYGSVRGGLRALGAGPAQLAAVTAPPSAPPLAATRPGSFALAAINGAWGDAVATRYDALALPLTLRRDGRDLPGDPEGLAAAVPAATDRIVVFVHGLGETDAAWGLGGGLTYGERLELRHGYTALYARYNTGRHISDNGRSLSKALDALLEAWPVGVREVSLVGHSMGGLVSRSACHYGEADDSRWTPVARHVVSLGTPHLGAPLERAAMRGTALLMRLPETAPLARLLTLRSAGIKDLRHGSLLDEDWLDLDPDTFIDDRCQEVPFLRSATYCFIGATVTRDKDSRLARVLGDLLVQFPSASGDGPRRRLAFEIDNGMHIGRINHLQLLNHPRVYGQLEKWLTRRPAALPA